MLNRQSPSSSVKSLCPLYSTYSSSSFLLFLVTTPFLKLSPTTTLISYFVALLTSSSHRTCDIRVSSAAATRVGTFLPPFASKSKWFEERGPDWRIFGVFEKYERVSNKLKIHCQNASLFLSCRFTEWCPLWCSIRIVFFMSIFFLLFTSPLGLVTLYQSWLGRLLNVFIVSASRNYLISASISPYPVSVLHFVLIRLSKIISIYWRILFLNMEIFFNFPSIF